MGLPKFSEFINESSHQNVQDFMSSSTYMEFDNAADGVLLYVTRKHGDVGSDTASHKDIEEAEKLAVGIKSRFGLTAWVSTWDEWVHLHIRVENPTRNVLYQFMKDRDGRGFVETKSTLEEIMTEFSRFMPNGFDWSSTIEKVKNETSYTTGYTYSKTYGKHLLIGRNDPRNNSGYDFYLRKVEK